MAITRQLAISVFLLSILTACQTTPSAQVPSVADQVYAARGNEPGWILKMDGKTIDYQGDYGQTKITIPAPEPRPSFNGMRHVADRLTVDITYSSCADDMSGKRFSDTVTVLADGKQLRGCGGRPLPPESLNETSWTILMMDLMPVLEGVATELRFADGKISGTAGCNRFNGSFTVAGNIVTVGPMVSTRMMCPEKQMVQEARFLSLLSGPLTKRYTVEGNLVLDNNAGQRVTLKLVL
jgi:heat shock protein HslJ